MEIKSGKNKTNHKKGIAARMKDQRRQEAEARAASYQKLSLKDKVARNSTKVRAKIQKKIDEATHVE